VSGVVSSTVVDESVDDGGTVVGGRVVVQPTFAGPIIDPIVPSVHTGTVVGVGGNVVVGGTVGGTVVVVMADVVVGGSVVDVVVVGGSVVGTVVGVGRGSVAEAAISKANRMKMIPVRMTSRWRTVRIPER
jgi:hypothetical protein